MDFKIAKEYNLSSELVMFNRKAYEEDVSSLSSDELLGQGGKPHGGLPGCYGGYFPEMPHDDLGSDGNHSPSPSCRHESEDEAVCASNDDFSHALFAQEQMLMNCFGNAEPTQQDRPSSCYSCSSESEALTNPRPVDTAVKCPPLVELQINSPSPSETSPSDAPTHRLVPSEPESASIITSSPLYDTALRRRRVDIAAWQRVLLMTSFQADSNQPRRQRLRELSERTNLPISIISMWFAEKRRSLRLRLKFGFCYRGSLPRSAQPRTPCIATIGHARCN